MARLSWSLRSTVYKEATGLQHSYIWSNCVFMVM